MNLISSLLCSLLIVQSVFGDGPTSKKEIVKINTSESDKNNQETIAINVETEKIDRDSKGNFADAEVLKVSVKVSVIEGNIHINGLKAKHGSVTAFHFHAEIDEIDSNKKVLKHHNLPVVIRVLVLEEKLTGVNTLNKLVVEAQIMEVYEKTVRKIDVTQVIMKLDNSKKELVAERKVTLIRIEESKIQKHLPSNDIDVHTQGGRLPKTKFHASKKQMDEFHHHGKLGPPMKPKNPLHADKTSFGGKVDHYENSICRGFYKLPFSVRLSIFLLIAFIGLLTLFCCIRAFCCKSAPTGKKFNLDDYDNKCDFDTEMDAPPLDSKIPLDRQKLVIDA